MVEGTTYPRKAAIAFIVCALVLMLIPLVGMIWARTDSTSENRELAPAPTLTEEDGTRNVDVLADAGAYFEDHFAYRNCLVDANAHLRSALGISATDQVIVGSDGWLYYGGTLSDYVGASALSDRELANVAHNLALLQGYAKARGASFVFAVAPNKNTLYGDAMPENYLRSPEPSNYERLVPYLEDYGVEAVDLLAILKKQSEAGKRLYAYRDTHWTNEGALIGANALLAALGASQIEVSADEWVSRDDLVGDVAGMLYPVTPGTETESYAAGVNDGEGLSGASWAYTLGAAVTDSELATVSTDAVVGGTNPQSLMMYRDSFGNALIPYLSSVFPQASYSKRVPYDASAIDTAQADTVIVERAERHIAYLAEAPFIMPAPRIDIGDEALSAAVKAVSGAGGEEEDAACADASLEVGSDGDYVVLEGWIDEETVAGADAYARIYVVVDNGAGQPSAYEAYCLSGVNDATANHSDWGYSVHIPEAAFGGQDALPVVAIVLNEGGELRTVARHFNIAL